MDQLTLFFNTTSLNNPDLKEAVRVCKTQRDKILNYFDCNRGKEFTVYEIWENVYHCQGILKTSVGRTVTTLLNEGLLEKCELKMERYGRPNYQYKLS